MCLLRNGEKMYLNTLGKNEMYVSVAEIVGADIEDVKRFVTENAADIVDCHYDEYGIEQMDLKGLLNGKEPKLIDSLIVHHITPREREESICIRTTKPHFQICSKPVLHINNYAFSAHCNLTSVKRKCKPPFSQIRRQ